jgi:hypothetical protein
MKELRHVMVKRLSILTVIAAALAMACSTPGQRQSSTTGPTPIGSDAASDGSTMKVGAPTPISPANGTLLSSVGGGPVSDVTVQVQAAAGKYATVAGMTYRFQLMDANSVVLKTQTSASLSTSFSDLTYNQTFKWRARAEADSLFGPWSATWTFQTPNIPTAYNSGSEVYDPLTNGKSIGRVNGPVTWLPGVGVRMDASTAFIQYALSSTITSGEFSVILTNMTSVQAGVDKTKVLTVCQGGGTDCAGGLTANVRRLDSEKRGTGDIAFRMITSADQIDTVGDERRYLQMDPPNTYFWKMAWNGAFNLSIRLNSPTGALIYSFGKTYAGTYDPNPLVAFIGAPPHSSGATSQTVPGMVVRGLWLSSRPRPDFANR